MTSTLVNIPTEVPTAAPQNTITPAPTADSAWCMWSRWRNHFIDRASLRTGYGRGACSQPGSQSQYADRRHSGDHSHRQYQRTDRIGLRTACLDVGSTNVLQTFEGGLWCLVPVSNPLDQSASAVTISVVLTDPGGKILTADERPAAAGQDRTWADHSRYQLISYPLHLMSSPLDVPGLSAACNRIRPEFPSRDGDQ